MDEKIKQELASLKTRYYTGHFTLNVLIEKVWNLNKLELIKNETLKVEKKIEPSKTTTEFRNWLLTECGFYQDCDGGDCGPLSYSAEDIAEKVPEFLTTAFNEGELSERSRILDFLMEFDIERADAIETAQGKMSEDLWTPEGIGIVKGIKAELKRKIKDGEE